MSATYVKDMYQEVICRCIIRSLAVLCYSFIDLYTYIKRLETASEHALCQCVAVSCSVLQCVEVCCSVLQRVAVCDSLLQCGSMCCIVLQTVTMC